MRVATFRWFLPPDLLELVSEDLTQYDVAMTCNRVGVEPECGDSVLILSVWFFAILTTLCGDPEAYTCMTT